MALLASQRSLMDSVPLHFLLHATARSGTCAETFTFFHFCFNLVECITNILLEELKRGALRTSSLMQTTSSVSRSLGRALAVLDCTVEYMAIEPETWIRPQFSLLDISAV